MSVLRAIAILLFTIGVPLSIIGAHHSPIRPAVSLAIPASETAPLPTTPSNGPSVTSDTSTPASGAVLHVRVREPRLFRKLTRPFRVITATSTPACVTTRKHAVTTTATEHAVTDTAEVKCGKEYVIHETRTVQRASGAHSYETVIKDSDPYPHYAELRTLYSWTAKGRLTITITRINK